MSDSAQVVVRVAVPADIPRMRDVIDASVRGLQPGFYTQEQIEGGLASVYGVDTQLIADGTYFIAEALAGDGKVKEVAACGGWSKRNTLYGGDQFAGREDSLLDPARDAAKIRAFFVHPRWARKGLGTLILNACEQAALTAGFTRLEMGATLSGVAFYEARGYAQVERLEVPLQNAVVLPIVRMAKTVARRL
jgi:GNAT superfamily N-acetyltransferase